MALWAGVVLLTAILDVAGTSMYCGYAITSHKVTSEDGYITTTFRLPRSSGGVGAGQPVLLQHGLLSTADTWFQIGDVSLPCMLARAGYDVWVTNARGNTYSTEHKTHNPFGIPGYFFYWDFSFHEMAVNDVTATIDYIRKETGKGKVSYIGHSMGGIIDFTLLSEVPKYNEKINVAVTLAPAVYIWNEVLDNLPGWLRVLRWLLTTCVTINWPVGSMGFTPPILRSYQNESMNEFVLEGFKTLDYILKKMGAETGFSRSARGILGFDRTSIKTLVHLCQLAATGHFYKYSYGWLGNWFVYGDWMPPLYNLTNVKTKQFIMYSDGDWIIRSQDVRRLCKELRNDVQECYKVTDSEIGHYGFLSNYKSKVKVNDVVLDILARYHPNPPPTTTTTTTEAVNPECLVRR